MYDSWLSSPIPGGFEEFTRNSDAIQMSTHWAQPKQQQMIKLNDICPENQKSEEASQKWNDGRRYQSETASKFRNYQL
ncbi:unnamed protein product [Caenorhabditis angaria]|uniref:Uncharacterized protein n=1 Tax=Caenorhabditis angaria TaxID=860376 RepID=A0A9P1INP5_9PELO|nr:unnamed protein product [Caenorhabditis angaria]